VVTAEAAAARDPIAGVSDESSERGAGRNDLAEDGVFRLPDVGEGLTEAEIVRWRVAVGDTVRINDVVVEIETAKSVVELPSPFAGTVLELHADEGSTAQVGDPIITIGSGEGIAAAAAAEAGSGRGPADQAGLPLPPPRDGPATVEPGMPPPAEPAVPPAVLVGYGPTQDRAARRRRRSPIARDQSPASGARQGPPRPAVLAKPPVRKLAKDLGVDLAGVLPSRADGVLTREDVLRLVAAAPELPDASDDTRIPVRGVRRATAAAMSASAFTAPHVTEFLTVDVTRSVTLVGRLRSHPAFDGSKVTVLLLAARALLAAVREHPEINASWDETAGEIVLHGRVNLGIAAATPRGLLVPNVKDAGRLTLPQLAHALTELATSAREGRSTVEDMSRGTITITNIGVFGVDSGTPILNPGEAAILCLGAVRRRPWEHKGHVALRWTTELSLSFDHRLVDGELGSRVLAKVGRVLEDPRTELLLS
jgi:pyruvate dehydrogenase E2 component (dihydrolipoamide acetyltransferase)